MNITRLLATAAMTAGLAIGLAATANAADAETDFWECVADHQDTDGIGVCCVFYGGTYDERTGECWDYPEAVVEESAPQPEIPPKRPVLTRLPSLPIASVN
jgi:nitrite reductase/ring-hydroxylating ferredoxin subunit